MECNTVVYSAAMSACQRGKQGTLALQLLRRMKQEGVEPNTTTYNTVIAACGRSRLAEAALEVRAKNESLPAARALNRGGGEKRAVARSSEPATTSPPAAP